MSDRNKIPGLIGTGRTEKIDPSIHSYPINDKIIISGASIYAQTLAGSFVEYGINETAEIAIYSDFPIAVAIDSPTKFSKGSCNFRFRGRITKLFIRTDDEFTPAGFTPSQSGVVVIYIGRPDLGVSFDRETWENREGRVLMGGVANNWAIGATIINPLFTWTRGVTTIPGTDYYGREGFYIKSFSFTRDAGLITDFHIRETETGVANFLYYRELETPRNRVEIDLPTPIRIATSFTVGIGGTSNAVLTTLMYKMNIVIL